MITFRFIERIDKRLDQLLFHQDIDQVQLNLKKYLFSANIITFSVVAVYNLITIYEDLGLLREYGYMLMTLNFSFAILFYWLRRGVEIFVFTYLLLTIILTTVFSIFCGGTTESGGIIFVGSSVIVISIILKNYRWSVALFILFIAFTVLAIYLQPILVPEPQLSSYINQKMFNINFLVLSTFIFIFSIYLISLLTRKEKEENERQRELNETKSRLYTNITHEFRTPLTVILGMAKSLRQNIFEDSQKKLSLIESNGESLLSLVEQMLKLSKLQSRNLSVKNIQADIIIFLKCILQSFEFQAKQRSIELNFISNVDKVEMDFDTEIIKTIVSNLLSNAIKFTDNHGFILLKTSTVDDQMVIEIKDTGIGIPDDQQKRIFDRFYQLQSQHTRNYGGVGIGLALTKELIDLLQGSIKLQSREGAGTTFTVMLPIQKKSSILPFSGEDFQKKLDESSPNAMPKQPAYAQPLKAEKEDICNNLVLIVEDNDDVIYYLRSCLPGKFKIETAKNGMLGKKEAVRLIPDIIISDVMMPESDGFTLCKYLKNDIRTSHIPIILLTAKGDLDSKLEGLRQGADDYVVKPFTQEELLARIQSLLLNRKILHQRYALPKKTSQSDDPLITQEDKFMENIQEIIHNNIDNEHLNISLLCKDLGMSKAQLYRKFKAITNHTIASYIRIIRLHKAKSIIENTTLNVTQAAISVGISNVSRFSRIFKKEFGLNPKEVKHLRSTNTA